MALDSSLNYVEQVPVAFALTFRSKLTFAAKVRSVSSKDRHHYFGDDVNIRRDCCHRSQGVDSTSLGFNAADANAYLQFKIGKGHVTESHSDRLPLQGRVNRALLQAVTMAPDMRLSTAQDAKHFLDNVYKHCCYNPRTAVASENDVETDTKMEDTPVPVLDVLQVILANTLKKPLEDVTITSSIRELVGMGTTEPHQVSERAATQQQMAQLAQLATVEEVLKKEFMTFPENGLTLSLLQLAPKFNAHYELGEVTRKLVEKMLQTKMPGETVNTTAQLQFKRFVAGLADEENDLYGLRTYIKLMRVRVMVVSCPEEGTLDPRGTGGPYDQLVMSDIEQLSKFGLVRMGFDRAGTTNASRKDETLDWSDKEEIKKSDWFFGYTTAVKGRISTERQGFDGPIELVCIRGGLVTQAEQEEMPRIVSDAEADMRRNGIESGDIRVLFMSYYDFRREYDTTKDFAHKFGDKRAMQAHETRMEQLREKARGSRNARRHWMILRTWIHVGMALHVE